ncbi:hypothetical protein ACUXGO_002583 [Staphylococcus cohnii]
MKKFILAISIVGVLIINTVGFKKYLARKNVMSNAEL